MYSAYRLVNFDVTCRLKIVNFLCFLAFLEVLLIGNCRSIAVKNFNLKPNLTCNICKSIDVVVQFYPWFKFYFPLFWGLVMYGNEFKTKGNEN